MEMIDPSANNQSNAQGSFGAMLQQARKDKQISIKEVADELFILERHLHALENEDFAGLPQVTFARGFAINYAKFLDLDPVRIAESFDAAYPNELKAQSKNNTDTPLRPMGTLQRDSSNRIRFNPLLIIAIIGLIILAVFLFRMVTNASQEDNIMSPPVVDEISASEQAQGAALDNQTSVAGLNDVGASGSALNLNATNSSTAALSVSITDNTNVNITDASGNDLMNGNQTSGNYELLGVPPFNVQIDNIDSVSLTLDQKPVSLNEYTTNKQADFTLTP